MNLQSCYQTNRDLCKLYNLLMDREFSSPVLCIGLRHGARKGELCIIGNPNIPKEKQKELLHLAIKQIDQIPDGDRVRLN